MGPNQDYVQLLPAGHQPQIVGPHGSMATFILRLGAKERDSLVLPTGKGIAKIRA